MEKLFAVCAPGLEPFTQQEVQALAMEHGNLFANPQPLPGGIAFEGAQAAIYLSNLWLRTASRVLLRLGEFYAATFSELDKKSGRLPWENVLKPGQPVFLRATCHHSKLYHSDGVIERVVKGITTRLKTEPLLVKTDTDGEDSAAQLIVIRLENNLCTISLDTSGTILHKRGYRLETAKAPLRETLAAAMLMASGWDGKTPLMDPFCGSGTIPIEAALLARRMAPGLNRSFSFMLWPGFSLKKWQTFLDTTRQQAIPCPVPIFASDRDAGAIQAATNNAGRAGVAGDIQFSCRAVSAIEPFEQYGWVVTNPPYGERLESSRDLRNLYARLGDTLRQKAPGWQAAFLCNDNALLRQTQLPFKKTYSFLNGGIRVKFAIT
jgi:putative N6-adenine-specific DNA methylase